MRCPKGYDFAGVFFIMLFILGFIGTAGSADHRREMRLKAARISQEKLKRDIPAEKAKVRFTAFRSNGGEGAIAGVVLTEEGIPIPSANVTAWTNGDSVFSIYFANTDSEGRYLLGPLPADAYYVVADARDFFPEFYDNVFWLDQASPVEVAESDTMNGVNFSLKAMGQATGAIAGRVLNQEGLPVYAASVDVFSFSNPFLFGWAETDESGNYTVTGLGSGEYIVSVWAQGYLNEFYDNARTLDSADVVPVSEPDTTPGIDFILDPGAVISGRVMNDEGQPIPFASIEAIGEDMVDSLRVDMWGFAQSDSTGYYEITGLNTGRYLVSAQAWTWWQWAMEYYDNAGSIEEATPVPAVEGQVTPNIDFNLAFSLASGSVSGIVTAGDGSPLAGVYIQAASSDAASPFWWGVSSAVSDSMGHYRIEELPPGTYYVSAQYWDFWVYTEQWYNGKKDRDEADPVIVEENLDTPGIDFTLSIDPTFGFITGTVRSEGDGSPVPFAWIEASPAGNGSGGGFDPGDGGFDPVRGSGNRGGDFGPSGYAVAMTDLSGQFILSYLPEGRYYVSVTAHGTRQYYDGSAMVPEALPVPVAAGDTTAGIDFTLPAVPDTGSTLSGKVIDDSTGEALRWAVVQAFPEWIFYTDGPVNWLDPHFYFISVSDSLGNYALHGLPAGKYYVQCWVDGYIGEFYDDVLDPSQAEQVEVDGENDTGGIDFALQEGWYYALRWDAMETGANAGVISGTVRDGQAAPIEGATLYALDGDTPVAFARTQADGGYQLTGLPEGAFYVQASRLPYQGEYYDHAGEIGQATQVVLDGSNGLAAGGIDFTLEPAQNSGTEDGNAPDKPSAFALHPNHPNPFNAGTEFHFELPVSGFVTLEIRNLLGQRVRTLVSEWKASGIYTVSWQGTDDFGQALPSGIYFCRMEAGIWQSVLKISLLR